LVKDLIHPVFLDIEWLVLIVILKIEKAHSSKQEDQENNDLVECMSENVAPHDGVDDLLVACVGLAFQKFFIGGSVARARAARVSMIRLTQSIWTGVKASSARNRAPTNTMNMAAQFTVSWN